MHSSLKPLRFFLLLLTALHGLPSFCSAQSEDLFGAPALGGPKTSSACALTHYGEIVSACAAECGSDTKRPCIHVCCHADCSKRCTNKEPDYWDCHRRCEEWRDPNTPEKFIFGNGN